MDVCDRFVGPLPCPSCKGDARYEARLMIEGVSMRKYVPGGRVNPAVLAAVHGRERALIEALERGFFETLERTPEDRPGERELLGQDFRRYVQEVLADLACRNGNFTLTDVAPVVERCACGDSPLQVDCIAMVEGGVFKGLSRDQSYRTGDYIGPLVFRNGYLFPHDRFLRNIYSKSIVQQHKQKERKDTRKEEEA